MFRIIKMNYHISKNMKSSQFINLNEKVLCLFGCLAKLLGAADLTMFLKWSTMLIWSPYVSFSLRCKFQKSRVSIMRGRYRSDLCSVIVLLDFRKCFASIFLIENKQGQYMSTDFQTMFLEAGRSSCLRKKLTNRLYVHSLSAISLYVKRLSRWGILPGTGEAESFSEINIKQAAYFRNIKVVHMASICV